MICDRQPAARANRRSLDRFGLVLAAFCVRLLAFPTSTFAEDEPAASITILVYNYAEVSPRILTGAEREADRILNRAGVRAVWFDCSGKQPTIDVESVCKSGWGSRNLGLRLLFRHVPTKFQDLTFGFALFPGLASVYYGDAALLADRAEMRSELPIILGCLIVHEVGHLLLKYAPAVKAYPGRGTDANEPIGGLPDFPNFISLGVRTTTKGSCRTKIP